MEYQYVLLVLYLYWYRKSVKSSIKCGILLCIFTSYNFISMIHHTPLVDSTHSSYVKLHIFSGVIASIASRMLVYSFWILLVIFEALRTYSDARKSYINSLNGWFGSYFYITRLDLFDRTVLSRYFMYFSSSSKLYYLPPFFPKWYVVKYYWRRY